MDYLTDLTFPSQNSDRFFQKYLSIGLNIVPGCPLVGSCYPVEGIMAFHDDSAVQQVRMGDRSKFSQLTFPFP